jgi:DNA polymerase-3 subunit gamma/tau
VSNAFKTGRIPQAWMLTGVRGVGKTTTPASWPGASISSARTAPADRPSNSTRWASIARPIIEGRHIDVMEIDAASNNGVDNVRQINDAVRYSPVSARYKVYIVDEVHMLSAGAFNAFLKTLEEPPPHAKFIFATTEINKVPVTILSRCQRFDLRRIEADTLIAHLEKICRSEGVEAEADALAAIARAGEGSARDSLSLLDQAIAHGAGRVTADTVRDMLGLADRAQVVDLFEAAMRGDVPASFSILRNQYDAGADPAVVLAELAAFSHVVTRLKLIPDAAKDPALTEVERSRGLDFAGKLTVRTLSRAWQILLKGVPEVQAANRPVAAAEMVLVRLAYAADLPTPDEALRALRDGTPLPAGGPPPSSGAPRSAGPSSNLALAASQPAPQPRPVPQAEAAPAGAPAPLRGCGRLCRRAARHRAEGGARTRRAPRALRGGQHRVQPRGGRQPDARERPRQGAPDWTGTRWMVALSSEPGAPTLHEQAQAAERERKRGAEAHPLVQAVSPASPAPRSSTSAAARPKKAARAPKPRSWASPTPRRPGRRNWTTIFDPSRSLTMRDMMGLMKQAQAMQQKMQDVQAELDNLEVEGASGGGVVTVKVTGRGPEGDLHRPLPHGAGREGDLETSSSPL